MEHSVGSTLPSRRGRTCDAVHLVALGRAHMAQQAGLGPLIHVYGRRKGLRTPVDVLLQAVSDTVAHLRISTDIKQK
jgi:hypothetical protein